MLVAVFLFLYNLFKIFCKKCCLLQNKLYICTRVKEVIFTANSKHLEIMGTFKTIKPSKENFELALSEGFNFLMTFESSKDIVVFNDLDFREEIINDYDYSNYNENDHRYTVQPIDIDELEQFNYFQ